MLKISPSKDYNFLEKYAKLEEVVFGNRITTDDKLIFDERASGTLFYSFQ
ncbi:hypothetical protein SIN_0127 [Streptococcus infantis SK1302]|uniref:Uncharacterized protein n=1 Tax=Streptococcus infantis SK1302 TaxID=871237 RepID=A0ABN0B7Q4_9STRE|nr:hypothetical protein SIN_0127 [Streptococcus infantis SK1302]